MGTSFVNAPPPHLPESSQPLHEQPGQQRQRQHIHDRVHPIIGIALLLPTLALLGMALAASLGHPLAGFPWTVFPNGTASTSGAVSQPAQAAGLVGGTDTPSTSTATSCSGNDRNVAGDSVTVDSDEWLCGSVASYGGDVTVLGRVGGNATSLGGDISISGEVDGDVTSFGGDVTLLPGAIVAGNVQSWGGMVHESANTTVKGSVGVQGHNDFTSPNAWYFFPGNGIPWLNLTFWALAAACVAYFFPTQLLSVERTARGRLGESLLAGAGVLILGIVGAVVLFVSCLGIPIALLLALALWLGSIFGTVALGTWLGGLIARGSMYRQRSAFVLTAVLGTVLLALAAEMPCVGGIARVLITATGLGAATLTLHHARTVPGYGRL